MFGYLGAPCRVCAKADHQHYQRLFCGVCNVLARRYGIAARWLINRDSTALAVAWAAQLPTEPVPALTTCCNPWGQPRPICQEGTGIEFAAAATLLGLGLKLRDDSADGGPGLRIRTATARRLLSRPLRAAHATLCDVGFDVTAVDQLWQAQLIVERRLAARRAGSLCSAEIASAGHASGALAALALGHTARLAGVTEQLPSWAAFGHVVGQIIYWLDAADDAHADRRQGQFNALNLVAAGRPVDVAREMLSPLLDQLNKRYTDLAPTRYHDLLRIVFFDGLTRRAMQLDVSDDDAWDDGDGEPGEEPGNQRRRRPSPPRASQQNCGWCDCGGYDCSGCQGCCDGVWCCSNGCDACCGHGDHDHNCCGCDSCGSDDCNCCSGCDGCESCGSGN